jgi:uncharacterized protein (DUF488 family)
MLGNEFEPSVNNEVRLARYILREISADYLEQRIIGFRIVSVLRRTSISTIYEIRYSARNSFY